MALTSSGVGLDARGPTTELDLAESRAERRGGVTALIISLIAHFAVGAAKSLFTPRSWWTSGLEKPTMLGR